MEAKCDDKMPEYGLYPGRIINPVFSVNPRHFFFLRYTRFLARHPHLDKLKPEPHQNSRLYAKTEPAIHQHFDEVGLGLKIAAEKSGYTLKTMPARLIGNLDEKPICGKKLAQRKAVGE